MRLPFSARALTLAALMASVAAPALCASAPPAAAGGSSPPRVVEGRVLDPEGRPAVGQIVAVGSSSVATDTDGRFVLAAPATYDLTVVSPDKASVSIYRGLTRRQPVLVHSTHGSPAPAHHAQIVGTLSGGGPYPLSGDALHVHFSSDRADGDVLLGGLSQTAPRGPVYGPITVSWDGPESVTGEVVALQLNRGTASLTSWFAHRPIALQDGATVTVDLALTPPPIVTRPAARLSFEYTSLGTQLHAHYRLAGARAALHAPEPSAASDYQVPDLRPFGATLCTEVWEWNPYARSRDVQCDTSLEKPTSLRLRAAPSFTSPASGTTATVGMRFEWSAVSDAVYSLKLSPSEPTPSAPRIVIVTGRRTEPWPDLRSLGVAFPQPLASYAATVSALGPYATMDEAAGPSGLGASRPSMWKSESRELSVPVQPPVGRDEGSCQYPYGAAIVCGKPTTPDGPAETYMLAAINNKLRHYPQFASAISIHCVRDCDGARAYIAAYSRYQRANPGFDAHEPIEPLPEPPPPPWLPNAGMPLPSPRAAPVAPSH